MHSLFRSSKYSLNALLSHRMLEQQSRIKKNSQLMSVKGSMISRKRYSSVKSMVADEITASSLKKVDADKGLAYSSQNSSYDDHSSFNNAGDRISKRISFVSNPRRLTTDGGEALGGLDELWCIRSDSKVFKSKQLSQFLDALDTYENPNLRSDGARTRSEARNIGRSEKNLRISTQNMSPPFDI